MMDRALFSLPHAKVVLGFLLVAGLVQATTVIGQSIALSIALSSVWAGDALLIHQMALSLFAACYAGRQLLVYVRDVLVGRYAQTQAAALRKQLAKKVFCGSVGFAARTGSAAVSDAMVTGVDQVETYLRVLLPKIAGLPAVSIPILVCVFAYDWVSGIILFVMFPVIMFFMIVVGRAAQARAQQQYAEYHVLSNHFIDTLRGLHTLNVFGAAKRSARHVFDKSEKFRRATMRTLSVATLSSALLDLIATCGVAAVAVMLGFRLMDGSLTLFVGLTCLILAPEFFKPIREFAGDFHASLDGRNAFRTIRDMVEDGQNDRLGDEEPSDRLVGNGQNDRLGEDEQNDRQAGDGQNDSRRTQEVIPAWTSSCSLYFEDVCISYDHEHAHATPSLSRDAADDSVGDPAGDAADEPANDPAGDGADYLGGDLTGDGVGYLVGDPSNYPSGDPARNVVSDASEHAVCEVPDATSKTSFSLFVDGITLQGFQRVAVIGASGAGKSSFVNVLGGFKELDSGRVVMKDGQGFAAAFSLDSPSWQQQIAYIPQRPYIFRASLRDNLAFYNPHAGPAQILDAVHAVGLRSLVDQLPQGLDTVIGDGGHGLSGGQAQRIALARVLLDNKRRILLLDEPTAHLDIQTEKELKECMLPLMEGRLVVIVTHRMHWLDCVDTVFDVDQGVIRKRRVQADLSRIGQSRNCSVLNDANNLLGLSRVNGEVNVCDVKDLSGLSCGDDVVNVCDANNLPGLSCGDDDINVCDTDKVQCSKGRTYAERGASDNNTHNKGASDSSLNTRATHGRATRDEAELRSGTRWLRHFVKRGRARLLGACALGVLDFACAALLMFSAGYLIGLTAQPNTALFAIMTPMAFVQLFGIGKPVARYIERLFCHDWVFRLTSKLRLNLYESVRMRFARDNKMHSVGTYLDTLSQDIGHLQNAVLRVGVPFVVACVVALVCVVVFCVVDVAFSGCVLVGLLCLTLGIPYVCYRLTYRLSYQEKETASAAYIWLTDNVLGCSDWIYAGRGTQACTLCEHMTEAVQSLQKQLRSRVQIARLISALLFGVCAVSVVMWSCMELHDNWVLAGGLVLFPLAEAFLTLPDAAQTYALQRQAISRLGTECAQDNYAQDVECGQDDHVQDAECAQDNYAQEEELTQVQEYTERVTPFLCTSHEQGRAQAQECTLSRKNALSLRFEHVSYSYPNTATAALHQIDLSLEAGQKVAVIGRSGAGKSTLLALARAAMKPSKGSVYIGEKSVSDLPAASKVVAMAEQNSHLFNQTLRDNIAFVQEGLTDDQITAALEQAGMGAVLAGLPEGLNTLVGEEGIRFSGGERQRIALARVFATQAPVVLFDEPSTGLDPATENALFDSIFAALASRTLVVVTHHLAQVDRFDRVILIDKGQIVLDGAPQDLQHTNDLFQQLCTFESGIDGYNTFL